MSSTRRPLPPLTGRKRTATKFLVAGYLIVAAFAFVAAATGDTFFWVFGVFMLLLAAAWAWDFRRRSDPARTAGWGRNG